MEILKKISFALLVLVISAGIFFLLVKDEQVKKDILRKSLDLFGDQLLAMVPDGEQKAALEKRYQEFLNKADKNEIPTKDIEKVAANILNLTTQDTLISAETAMNVLAVIHMDTMANSEDDKNNAIPKPPLLKTTNDQLVVERRTLAKKLQQLQKFKKQLDIVCQMDSSLDSLRTRVVFLADSGLKAAISINFKDAFDPHHSLEITKEIEQLEKEKMLEWHENARTFQEAKAAVAISLHNLPPSPPPSVGHFFKEGERAALDSLAIANPDSFRNLIRIKVRDTRKKYQRAAKERATNESQSRP